jgi:hypothetical protein
VIVSALFIQHALFLHTPPSGPLILAGGALIALGFACSGLAQARALKILIPSAAAFLAIAGTWWWHRMLADSPARLTPIFPYDYGWPAAQIGLIALGVSLLLGLGGAPGLAPDEA